MIDHLLFLSKTAANLEGMIMYIFRKNNYCLPLAKKHSLEIFSELKEIKQRNEVVEKYKRPYYFSSQATLLNFLQLEA